MAYNELTSLCQMTKNNMEFDAMIEQIILKIN
jgi:hypothetical protein